MLKMPSKKTKTKSGRISLENVYKMEKEDLDVKQCVDIAISSRITPNKEKEYLLRKYISKSDALSMELSYVLNFIDQLKKELGMDDLDDEQIRTYLFDDTEKAIQTTLDRYASWKGTSKFTIGDFINSRNGKRIIEVQAHNCDLTQEDFINLLFERVDESIQSTLDG